MIRRCKPILGTFVEIKVTEEIPASHLAVEEAFEEIEKVHSLMSFFDEKSQVSILNRDAYKRQIKVDYRLFEVLNLARNISEASDGVFDITFHRSALEYNPNFFDIELLPDLQVKFKKPLKIDLAGIAKGYAVDRAAKVLESRGVLNYVINAGGDLRVGKELQEISIRNPQKLDSEIYKTKISNSSVASSAGYFSYQEVIENDKKKIFYPIFKKQGSALEYNNESISVISESCAVADGLTKVTMILKEESSKVLSKFASKAIFVNSVNQIKIIN